MNCNISHKTTLHRYFDVVYLWMEFYLYHVFYSYSCVDNIRINT